MEYLDLTGNDLTGAIPPEMGELARLEALHIGRNGLTGIVPDSFLRLGALADFNWRQDAPGDLCLPSKEAWHAWLKSMQVAVGPLCDLNRPPEVGSMSTPEMRGWLTLFDAPMRPGESWSTGVPGVAFHDPDGDPLRYGASTSDAGVATANMEGGILTISAVAAGAATVTVTARDPGGLEAALSVAVVVVGE